MKKMVLGIFFFLLIIPFSFYIVTDICSTGEMIKPEDFGFQIAESYENQTKEKENEKSEEKDKNLPDENVVVNRTPLKDKIGVDLGLTAEEEDNFIYVLNFVKKNYDLNKHNKEVKGWIHIKGYLDQPFVDTPYDMQKYIRKGINGKYLLQGTPFMSVTSLSTLNGSSLIYGHNMKDGSSFGSLRHITTQKLYDDLKPLVVYDSFTDTFRVYKIFTFFNLRDGKEFVQLKHMLDDGSEINNEGFFFANEHAKGQFEASMFKYNKGLAMRSKFKNKDENIDYSGNMLFLQHCTVSKDRALRDVLGFYEVCRLKSDGTDFWLADPVKSELRN